MVAVTPDKFPDKARQESIVHGVDFTNELGSDTINTQTWESSPSGLTFTNQTLTLSNRQANAEIGGGSANTNYTVSVRVVSTTSAETLEARVSLFVLADP